jgi:hypothetical protein
MTEGPAAVPTAGPTSGRMTTPRIEKIALRLPDWMGSIRFRLTAMYSIVLFGLAAMVVAGIYLALAERLDDATVYARLPATRVEQLPDGRTVVQEGTVTVDLETFEQRVNRRASTCSAPTASRRSASSSSPASGSAG